MAGEIVRIGFFFQLRLFLSFIAGLWDDKKTVCLDFSRGKVEEKDILRSLKLFLNNFILKKSSKLIK